jgi:hypothetical protein
MGLIRLAGPCFFDTLALGLEGPPAFPIVLRVFYMELFGRWRYRDVKITKYETLADADGYHSLHGRAFSTPLLSDIRELPCKVKETV